MSTAKSLDLDAVKARAEAATPGPWKRNEYRVYVDEVAFHGDDRLITACWRRWGPVTGQGSIEADAEFISHARADVPALVAEVERLRAELATAQLHAGTWA